MNIKHPWPKFIPLLGIIFCLIDISHDGEYWERLYIYYHVVISGIVLLILK
jgi:hypothetical protein